MVNASLNWASWVGVTLVVFGLYIFYLTNQKPALSRGYDGLIGIIAVLCGAILFFQGWRLDPILQFGQSLLAGIVILLARENYKMRRSLASGNSEFFDDTPIKRTTTIMDSYPEEDSWGDPISPSYSERKRLGNDLKCSYCGARFE